MDSIFATDMLQRAETILRDGKPELAEKFLKVPIEYYRSDEYARRERDIFETTPLLITHGSNIGKAYDYETISVFGRSLLVTRNDEGTAHVFLNTCRHRGAEPAKGCGNQRRFVCPYHAWTYDIDGRLLSMPAKDRYEGLPFDEMGLVELSSEERHGFIWAILTPGMNIDVAGHLGELDAELASWQYQQYTSIGDRSETTLECNWKALAEGLNESWHVPVVHPGTFNQYINAAPDLAGYDSFGPHMRWFVPLPGEGDGSNIREKCIVIYNIFPNLTLSNGAAAMGGSIAFSYYPGQHTQESFLRVGYIIPDTEENRQNPGFHLEKAEDARRAAVDEDGPVLSSCGRGFRNGVGHALIGRNEKGLQIMTEAVAQRIGCPLTYV